MSDNIFVFYHNRKDFYRVKAKSKEHALEILDKAEDSNIIETFYDQSEVDMDWVFYGEKEYRNLAWEWVPKK